MDRICVSRLSLCGLSDVSAKLLLLPTSS